MACLVSSSGVTESRSSPFRDSPAMTEPLYTIPLARRRTENLHIVFWLMKDISWCLMFRTLGVIMIVPTLGAALYITWRARDMKIDFAHNLAVVFWISANAWWMIAEFFEFDEIGLWHGISGRHFALIPFAIGAAILLYHYLGELLAPRVVNAAQ
jgi:hypothetical protein